MRRRGVSRAVALAVVGGGLWGTSALGDSSETAKRSVYDRSPATASSESTSEPGQLPLANPAEQRPLSEQRPLGKPRRARGYLSHDLADARKAADRAGGLTSPSARPAAAKKAPQGSAQATKQQVTPAFFPAPIGVAGESARTADAPLPASHQIAAMLNSPAEGEHPLSPAVRWAKHCMQKMQAIQDYSAKMAKRERIDGALTEYEYLKVKVRHEPFSVYVGFIGPAKVKGQEAIYVNGRNDGKLLAHANGMRKIFGTVSLKPDSMLAMTGNRYPITEMGIRRLTERLIEVGEHDAQFGECEVKAFPNTKINGRDCVCLRVVHPVRRREFLFNMAKIYVDSEHNVPVRYEAYDWPDTPGGEPVLTEEYTYLELKLNNGFTDRDFEVTNPEYQFR
ncbi:MAG TPA: DUF1571 domain-containing protein [Pirellulales bacterium]|nr:DUF1571 domain-containing protein [Pirellulales bacterium]